MAAASIRIAPRWSNESRLSPSYVSRNVPICDHVAGREPVRAADPEPVDPGAVRRAAVAQHVVAVLPREVRVAPRDQRLVEDDVGARAADREERRARRRGEVLHRRDPPRERVQVDEGDQVRGRRIAEPHDVAVVEHGVGDVGAAERARTRRPPRSRGARRRPARGARAAARSRGARARRRTRRRRRS